MNKKILDKITSIGITLALSSSIGLSACAKKENNYIPMNEIFYDENTDGIDDTFEQKITDSTVQIQNITKLEKSIKLIKQLKNINYKDVSNNEFINITKEDIDNLNIDEIENLYEDYQKITEEIIKETDYHNQEKLYSITKKLYESYIKLNTYINNYGYNNIYNFGTDLYKAIILDTANFDGNETNVSALIGQYQGSGSDNSNRATYTSDSGYQAVLDINPKSKLYSLIGKVSQFEEYSDIEDFHLALKYDEKTIEELEETLDFYKECIYTNYEIKDKSFLFLKEPEEIDSKETNVPTR